MQSIQSITKINNEAIRSYESGQLLSAENFLAKALFFLNKLRERLHSEILEQCTEKSFQFQTLKSSIIRWSKPFPLHHVEKDVIMFTRGIFLEEHDHLLDKASSFSPYLEMITLALFYNASMINHFYSYMAGEDSLISNGAYIGYEVAFAIFNKIDRQSSYISIQMKLLKLALFNNIGVLFCTDMCRFRDAAECFEAFREEIPSLIEVLLDGEDMTTTEAEQLSSNLLAVPCVATPAA